MKSKAFIVLAAFASGCGGGGDSGGAPPPAPPPAANTAPLAADASLATPEDSTLLGTLVATDADGQALTFAVSRQPAHGTLSVNSGTGSFNYRPSANYSGTDDFQFTAYDGRVLSNIAQVSIQVSPVNDAPAIDRLEAPVGAEAGQTVALVVHASDVEGSVTIEVVQTGGVAVTDLLTRADGIEFRLPESATVRDATFRVRVVDSEGAAVERAYAVAVWPVSASGRLTTLFGSSSSPGMHWIITGDGFRASERGLLLQRAHQTVNAMLAEPALQPHRGIWNVHVLSVASQESGADVPSIGEMHDTAFDAAFDCAGIARLLCVDWGKVLAQVIPEFADYDVMLVMVNSDRYGGSGGATGAVVSLHPTAPRSALHEMGHTLAGLGDEYVDSTVDALRGGSFVEGTYPNLTQQRDVALIPWRHWFADPNNIPTTAGLPGIGRFEGGYYAATGIYRPTFDSFMRTTTAPVNSVQAEAWTRAIYRQVGPIVGSSPTPGPITLAVDERRTFGVVRAFAGAVQSVRWYLDGNEVVAARDVDEFACCTGITGSHVLRVEVTDTTGVIRLPNATEGNGTRRWDLTIDPNLAPGGTSQSKARVVLEERADSLLIRVRVDEAGHHVEDIMRVHQGRPRAADAGADAIHFEFTDATGATLSKGEAADPRVTRGPMPLPGERISGHDVIRLASGTYVIRVSDEAAIRYLRLRPARNAPQVIDLGGINIR